MVKLEQKDASSYEAIIKNDKNWKSINKVILTYWIVEEVVDYRGTSSSTHIVHLFESKKQMRKNPTGTLKIPLHFPKNQPGTIAIESFNTYWVLNIKTITSIGMVYNHRSKIDVIKT